MHSLGQKLKKLRKAKKLTQVDVAAAIGVSRPFLTAIENGREYPGRETLMATANYFNVSLDWLTSDQDQKEPASAKSEDEALLLYAFRNMPEDEAKMHLQLMLKQATKILKKTDS